MKWSIKANPFHVGHVASLIAIISPKKGKSPMMIKKFKIQPIFSFNLI